MDSKPIVIVGAGLGGMAAGVALAQQGHRVILLEKEPQLGGYAVAYARKGFSFDVALHVVPAGAAGGEFHTLVTELGLADAVRFVRLEQGFRARLGDTDLQMPNDYEALFRTLEREFPAEQAGLRAFRTHFERHVAVYARLLTPSVSRWRAVPPFIPRIPAFLKHASMPVSDYLAPYVQDQRLRALLYLSSIFLGIPANEFPTLNFMMMFHILFGQGMYTMVGGGQALTDALARRLKELDVRIVTGTEVEQVLLEGQAAVGVRTTDGTVYEAAAVLAGVSTPELVNRLIGRPNVPAGYLKTLDSLRPSLSVLVLNLGLDRHPRELGIDNYITVVFPDANIDDWIRKQRCGRLLHGFSVTARGNAEPDAPPSVSATLSIVGGVSADAWSDLPDEAYAEAKKEATADILKKLEKAFPQLAGHVIFSDLSTPRTLRRYTGNPAGAIMGFDASCGMHRKIMTVSRLPIGRLYPAGAWTDRYGGFMQSIKAGMAAAEKAARAVAKR